MESQETPQLDKATLAKNSILQGVLGPMETLKAWEHDTTENGKYQIEYHKMADNPEAKEIFDKLYEEAQEKLNQDSLNETDFKELLDKWHKVLAKIHNKDIKDFTSLII
jgi:hypothetical protein